MRETRLPRPTPGARRLAWWLYAAAWLPYVGLNVAAFLSFDEPLPVAVPAALFNVLPLALFGVALRRVPEWLPWESDRRVRFYAVHGALAVLFGALCAFATFLLFVGYYEIAGGGVPAGSYRLSIALWHLIIGVLAYAALGGIFYAVTLFRRYQEERARAAEARALQTQAELRALRAQIDPHFLFNTLHTLLSLVRSNPAAAEQALEQFGDLLHYVLRTQSGDAEEVVLASEWEFVENYLALEKLRLGERLLVRSEIDAAAREAWIPAFSLQPLVENAIRHGIAPRAGGGTLSIRVARAGRRLVLEVRDDGRGAETAAVENGRGLGLGLVRRRLEVLHGPAADLAVETAPGRGFAVRIEMPWRESAAPVTPEPEENRWRSAP